MSIVTVGLELAKQVFQVHGGDETGRVGVRRQLRRDAVESFFRALPAWSVWKRAARRIIGHGGSWRSAIVSA